MDVPKLFGMKKAPNAAIADVNPMMAAAFLVGLLDEVWAGQLRLEPCTSLRMIAGIIWNVDALPTPLAAKQNRKLAKNTGKQSGRSSFRLRRGCRTVPRLMATKTQT